MPSEINEKVVITDVPFDRLAFYKQWAESMGGRFITVQQEPDGEFTIVILVPTELPAT